MGWSKDPKKRANQEQGLEQGRLTQARRRLEEAGFTLGEPRQEPGPNPGTPAPASPGTSPGSSPGDAVDYDDPEPVREEVSDDTGGNEPEREPEPERRGGGFLEGLLGG